MHEEEFFDEFCPVLIGKVMARIVFQYNIMLYFSILEMYLVMLIIDYDYKKYLLKSTIRGSHGLYVYIY